MSLLSYCFDNHLCTARSVKVALTRLHAFLIKFQSIKQTVTSLTISGFMFGFSDRRTRRNISWAFWSPLDRDGPSCSILNNFFREPGSGLSLCTNKCLFLGCFAAFSSILPLARISRQDRSAITFSKRVSMSEDNLIPRVHGQLVSGWSLGNRTKCKILLFV